ncbi:membrane trafficking protein, ER to Golgi Psg1 [Schizosaccharomyces osmophilus]|uniref:Membrane trafficking protein, ER to Golgi Psg1 n=1 Tax=Schizosaccharomyces osmophilus TaxID=2545709 RepID=A0AAF0AU01_9SCHI|nr:membrane trafficking protein, ER to Golgi Psg1 [Schizosaccharomyces osmophilus]WBW71986.1 membrane trafficking protein, ER to Golgi Psg1 [Schizosaccharomyces osmophilus]
MMKSTLFLSLFSVVFLAFASIARADVELLTPGSGSRWAVGYTYAVRWKQPAEEFLEVALENKDQNNTVITSSGIIPSNQTFWFVKIDKKWLNKQDNKTTRIVVAPQNGEKTKVQVGPEILLSSSFYWMHVVDKAAFDYNPIDKRLAIGISVALTCSILLILVIHISTRKTRRILASERKNQLSTFRG